MAGFYRFKDIQIDLRSFRLFRGGRTLSVEPKALTLLIFLVENRGRLVRKRELMEAVWSDAFVTEQVLSRAIAQLRKALGDSAREPRYIETVPTLGFRFIAEVESDSSELVESPAERSQRKSINRAASSREPELAVLDSTSESAHQPRVTVESDSMGRRRGLFAGRDTRQRAPSVGVLPFVNLSADAENEFFADGITQDVIAHLTAIRISVPDINEGRLRFGEQVDRRA